MTLPGAGTMAARAPYAFEFPDDPEWLRKFHCDWAETGKLTMAGFPETMPSSMRLYLAAILPKQWPRALEMIMDREDHSFIGDAEISFSSNWLAGSSWSEQGSAYSGVSFGSGSTGDCVEFCAGLFPVAEVPRHRFLRVVGKAFECRPKGFLDKEKELLQRFEEHVDDVCRQACSTKEPQGTEEELERSQMMLTGEERAVSRRRQPWQLWGIVRSLLAHILLLPRRALTKLKGVRFLGMDSSSRRSRTGLCVVFVPTKLEPILQLHVYIIPNDADVIEHLKISESQDLYSKWDQEPCELKPGETYYLGVNVLQGECSTIRIDPEEGLDFEDDLPLRRKYYRKFRVNLRAKETRFSLTVALELVNANKETVCKFQTGKTLNTIQGTMEGYDSVGNLFEAVATYNNSRGLSLNPVLGIRITGSFAVLLVSHEYGSSKIGISTINRQLALVLIAAGVMVFSTVLEATEQDERDAEQDGVTLIKPETFDEADSIARPSPEWLTVYHSVHFPHIPSAICCIIGHANVTSRAAMKIKEDRFPDANLILFDHDMEYTTLSTGKKESSIKQEMCNSDTVFSVGARIYMQLERLQFLRKHSVTHHVFLPEPSKLFTCTSVTHGELSVAFKNQERFLLSLCKVRNAEELEDHGVVVQATDLVAKRLRRYSLNLNIRGIDEKDIDESQKLLEKKLTSGRMKPRLLPYGTKGEIREEMETIHLLLLPSRAEPFGLVGLEAIAAGVPVLMSGQSGLAKLIEELSDTLRQPTFRQCIVEAKEDFAAHAEKWAYCIEDFITNTREKFIEAQNFREKLLASRYWVKSHRQFVQACGITSDDRGVEELLNPTTRTTGDCIHMPVVCHGKR